MVKAARRTKQELEAFYDRTVPDIIAPGLRVLFCGINPSLTSAAEGCHFARPGNRFWPALHAGGFTPERLHPSENRRLLDFGLGVTNVVARATRNAGELSAEEYRAGVKVLESKCRRYRPAFVAVLGIGAYRTGFEEPAARLGLQVRTLGDAHRPTRVYVLPNPSGLNAYFTPAALGELFATFRELVEGRTEDGRR